MAAKEFYSNKEQESSQTSINDFFYLKMEFLKVFQLLRSFQHFLTSQDDFEDYSSGIRTGTDRKIPLRNIINCSSFIDKYP